MGENLEKAKKLFFDYSCNLYFMARDAMDIEFKKLGATKEHEAEWRKEYIDYWTARLSTDNLEAVDQLDYAWAVEAMPDLLKMCNQAEGYAKLQYANTIWHLTKDPSLGNEIRQQAVEASIEAWKALVEGNFNVPEHFQKKIFSGMPPIDATNATYYVIKHAKRQLEEAKKSGNA